MIGIAAGFAAVLVLALYINGDTVERLYPHRALWLTVPILLYWISRMWMKAHRGKMHDDPVVFALTDGLGQLSIAAFLGVLLVAARCAWSMRPVSSWGRLSRDTHRVVDLPTRLPAPAGASPARDSPACPSATAAATATSASTPAAAVGDARARSLHRLRRPNRRASNARAGVLLKEMIDLALPRGWFPAVTPGTQCVTVGGADGQRRARQEPPPRRHASASTSSR